MSSHACLHAYDDHYGGDGDDCGDGGDGDDGDDGDDCGVGGDGDDGDRFLNGFIFGPKSVPGES